MLWRIFDVAVLEGYICTICHLWLQFQVGGNSKSKLWLELEEIVREVGDNGMSDVFLSDVCQSFSIFTLPRFSQVFPLPALIAQDVRRCDKIATLYLPHTFLSSSVAFWYEFCVESLTQKAFLNTPSPWQKWLLLTLFFAYLLLFSRFIASRGEICRHQ